MIEITQEPISPEIVVNKVKTEGSGCVVTYVGLIRGNSHGKQVLSVEYRDTLGTAKDALLQIVNEAKERWQLEEVAFTHRTGILKVGDINLVIAIAAAHRQEGFAAAQFIIDRFKQKLPTDKTETYQDGTTSVD